VAPTYSPPMVHVIGGIGTALVLVAYFLVSNGRLSRPPSDSKA